MLSVTVELRPQHLPVLPVTLGIDSIIDTKSHETLVQRAWVTSGYGSLGHSMKFWVGLDACNPDGESFNSFEYAYRDLRGNP